MITNDRIQVVRVIPKVLMKSFQIKTRHLILIPDIVFAIIRFFEEAVELNRKKLCIR